MCLKFDNSRKWYLGFDIGTNSIGWAGTDEQYNLLKFNGNATWGVCLFDEAKTAAKRRVNRTARRRLLRRKQRISILQDFFASAIAEKDAFFYTRLKESQLWSEDKSVGKGTDLFVGNEWNDRLYNRTYPTIHHLICELMESKEYHDPRLVYLACSYILSHRGHFLIDVSKENVDKVTDFSAIYELFLEWFSDLGIKEPWTCSGKQFSEIMKKNLSSTKKEKAFYELLFGGRKPDEDDECPVSVKAIISFLSGRKTRVADLFKEEMYKQLDIPDITASSASFEEQFENLSDSLKEEEYELLARMKRIYDWSLLVDILREEKYISVAKVKAYETHKDDLRFLKYVIKKYCPDKYSKVFRLIGKENNYPRYSYNIKDLERNKQVPKEFKDKCSQEDFCKFVLPIVQGICDKIACEDSEKYKDMLERLELGMFCPKQVTSDNRVVPYQLYYIELSRILENAKQYLSFLNVKDEYGTIADKILSIMTFRIPYYVGPLNEHSEHAWIMRMSEGKITPWNFDQMVDKDACEKEFIRRMTNKCTYLAGKNVLPKFSMLYSKFMVLNEINNLRVDDIKISIEAKQGIYENLFMKKRRVSVEMIKEYLVANGFIYKEQELQGIDETIKSALISYHDFKQYIEKKTLSERQVEDIILHITLTTDRDRLRTWLKNTYKLDDIDIQRISRLSYSKFGRLSKEFLTQVLDLDDETGEIRREENIIAMLWSTNENLMSLLSSKYGYLAHIQVMNEEYYSDNPRNLDQRLNEMFLSNAVKRPILRTLEIAKELNKIFKCPPEKIFIEMARGGTDEQRGKRTKSRRDQIKQFYASFDKQEVSHLLQELELVSDSQLHSERLFLYFVQLGRCMYSGEPINISELGTKMYDIDHIWPRSKVKDDSIDNKVLVLSKYNGNKGDDYPVPEAWRIARLPMWKKLHKNGLISDKKLDRLKRATRFTDEELASFINRQLIETRQSTKAIARILKDYFPNTEIVYVKAGLVSDFRQEYKDELLTLKCREVNDFHHAKDAYLNIVLGNVFHTKFTSNPLNFIKSGDSYSLKIRSLLEHDVNRNGKTAWIANNIWLKRVADTLHKNNIRFVRYSYCQKGALFDVKPLRKGLGQIPRKRELDNIDKYGGYNKQTIAAYCLLRYSGKKEKETTLVGIPLSHIDSLQNVEQVRAFCENLGYKDCELLLNGRLIKVNTLFELDGYRVHLSGKSGGDIWFKGAQQLVISIEDELYIKKVYKFVSRYIESKEVLKVTERDGISLDRNASLYSTLSKKMSETRYSTLMNTAKETLMNGVSIFSGLSIEKQCVALTKIVELFDCSSSQGVDLTLIGGAKSSGIQKMTMKLNKDRFKSIRIIDQSPTGLFEKTSPNLLDL